MRRTKRLLAVVIVVSALLIIIGCSKKQEGSGPVEKQANAGASNPVYMRLSLIEGDVLMKTAEADNWGYASMNSPISEGDDFWVPPNGRLEIQLEPGTYVRLDKESRMSIFSKEKDSLQFYLSSGHAYVVHDASDGSRTQVDSAGVSTSVRTNSIFRVDLINNKYTEVGVYKEYANTQNDVGITKVNAGEMVSLGLGTDGQVAPMGPRDEWERWNQSRNDKLFNRGPTEEKVKLPKELKPYSSDFDNYGEWRQVPEYGTVWTPTAGAGADWAPYREGRWVWRNNDYVWVASEQWGWAPYHYGRWAFVAGIGWCWVPPASDDVYWSPGYVGWVRTEDYVAWVPLAPGETYYGRGLYGPHSVNIIGTNISQVSVANVYKNVQVNNGVTVVRRDTFATASPAIVKLDDKTIQQKVFVKDNINIGTPSIRPTAASYFASSKMVTAENLPPQSVRDIKINELKQSRQVVKEDNQSAFTSGKSVGQLPVHTVKTPIMRGQSKPPALVQTSEGRELEGEQGKAKDNKPTVKSMQGPSRDQNEITKQQSGKGEDLSRTGHQGQVKDNKPKVKAVQSLGGDQNQITKQQPAGGEDRSRVGQESQAKDNNKPRVKAVQSLGRTAEGGKDQTTVGATGDQKPRVKAQQSLGRDQSGGVSSQGQDSKQVRQGSQQGSQQVKQGSPQGGQQVKQASPQGAQQVKQGGPQGGQQVRQNSPQAAQQVKQVNQPQKPQSRQQSQKQGEKDDKKQ